MVGKPECSRFSKQHVLTQEIIVRKKTAQPREIERWHQVDGLTAVAGARKARAPCLAYSPGVVKGPFAKTAHVGTLPVLLATS